MHIERIGQKKVSRVELDSILEILPESARYTSDQPEVIIDLATVWDEGTDAPEWLKTLAERALLANVDYIHLHI